MRPAQAPRPAHGRTPAHVRLRGPRGTRTGRALVEAREAAAREMGLTRLVADTLSPNAEMRSLYPKLGFV